MNVTLADIEAWCKKLFFKVCRVWQDKQRRSRWLPRFGVEVEFYGKKLLLWVTNPFNREGFWFCYARPDHEGTARLAPTPRECLERTAAALRRRLCH